MSQDQMNWTPAEGVRTCGQIYLHVAEANFMLAGFMSGAEMEGEPGKMEKKTTDKNEIAKMLKDSFTAIKEAAGKLTEEDLERWTEGLTSGALSKADFEFLLKGKRDLAEMEALKQLGLSKIRINKITNGVIEVVVGSAVKTFL